MKIELFCKDDDLAVFNDMSVKEVMEYVLNDIFYSIFSELFLVVDDSKVIKIR